MPAARRAKPRSRSVHCGPLRRSWSRASRANRTVHSGVVAYGSGEVGRDRLLSHSEQGVGSCVGQQRGHDEMQPGPALAGQAETHDDQDQDQAEDERTERQAGEGELHGGESAEADLDQQEPAAPDGGDCGDGPARRRSLRLLDRNGVVRPLQSARITNRVTSNGRAGEWEDNGLVFTTVVGTAMDAANVRRDLRRALAFCAGIDLGEWTPRELRHSFVSVLSDGGVIVEEIVQLVGHSGTTVTELVYWHQLRPVIQTGATVMDRPPGRCRPG